MTADQKPSKAAQSDREAYFSGEISAAEYVRRAIPEQPRENSLSEQVRRVLERLSGKARAPQP